MFHVAFGRLKSKSEWHQTHFEIKFRNKNNGELKEGITLIFSHFIYRFWFGAFLPVLSPHSPHRIRLTISLILSTSIY